MKAILKTLIFGALALCSVSCAKVGEEFVHDDATISAIYMRPSSGSSSLSISGVIDNDNETIKFTVPKTQRRNLDISSCKLRANVGYDVQIKPSLEGIKDLSEPLDITVTATMTGRTQKYTITAKYE